MRYKAKQMEITISNRQILTVLHVLTWALFIGLCVETGGILFNTIYALYKPVVAQYFWNRTDLSALYQADRGRFITLAAFMVIASVMKTLIFYFIVRLFHQRKLNFSRPFQPDVIRLLFNIAILCLGAGVFSAGGSNYIKWIEEEGLRLPDADQLRIGGADVWIFMAVVLFVIGQVFRKGVELQTENDLTV